MAWKLMVRPSAGLDVGSYSVKLLARQPGPGAGRCWVAEAPIQGAERHLAPLRLLGAEPSILEATPLALTNALLEGGGGNGDARALLDIGYTSSHLTLYQPESPYFTRRLDFGGHQLTRAIAAARGIPLVEAETWKLAAGAAVPGGDAPWEGPEWQAMLDCLRTELMAELKRSFAFY